MAQLTNQMWDLLFFAGAMHLAIFLAVIGASVLWLFGLVHCLSEKKVDRTVWVLVVLLAGPIGALLYFAIGRDRPGADARGVALAPRVEPQPARPRALAPAVLPPIDREAIEDPKRRASAIVEACWAQGISARRGPPSP